MSPCYSEINILEDLSKRFNYNTPDYLDLKQVNDIPVFVFDDFKIGGEKFHYLSHCPHLGEARTVMDCFQMEQCAHSNTPMIRKLDKATKNTPMGSVIGEVYIVDPITMLELDKVMGNRDMFTRELHWVWMEEQNNPLVKGRPNMRCWMYMKNLNFWNNKPVMGRIPKLMNGKSSYEWVPKKPVLNDIPWN